MKLRQLEYFLGVVDHKSFSRAAEALFVTQPTLSTQIQELESQVGCPLFDRVGREIRLTEAGRILEPFARSAVQSAMGGQTAMRELRGLERGTIKIGASPFFNDQLPNIMNQFLAEYPNVKFIIKDITPIEIEQALARGELDLGLSLGPSTEDSKNCEVLLHSQLALVVSRKHRLAGKSEIRFAELDGEPMAIYRMGHAQIESYNRIFADAGASPRVVCETDSMGVIFNLIRNSNISTIAAMGMLEGDPELVAIPLVDPEERRDIIMLWPDRHFRFAAVSRFADMVRREYLS